MREITLTSDQMKFMLAHHEEVERALIDQRIGDDAHLQSFVNKTEYKQLFQDLGWDEVLDRFESTPGYDISLRLQLLEELKRDLENGQVTFIEKPHPRFWKRSIGDCNRSLSEQQIDFMRHHQVQIEYALIARKSGDSSKLEEIFSTEQFTILFGGIDWQEAFDCYESTVNYDYTLRIELNRKLQADIDEGKVEVVKTDQQKPVSSLHERLRKIKGTLRPLGDRL